MLQLILKLAKKNFDCIYANIIILNEVLMNSVNSYNPQTATVLNNNNDRKKEYYKNLAISTTGTVVAWEAEPIIKKITRLPFSKYIKNNFHNRIICFSIYVYSFTIIKNLL